MKRIGKEDMVMVMSLQMCELVDFSTQEAHCDARKEEGRFL